jgi:endonuclease YncB( thermonuclease family)
MCQLSLPLAGIPLAELKHLCASVDEQRAVLETRLATLEARKNALFADGVNRADHRGQEARARQIDELEIEANQVTALLRIAHKQRLLLDRLIWLRENLAAIERLQAAAPAAVPFDWPTLVDATTDAPDEEAQLDELNRELQMAEGKSQMADSGHPPSAISDQPSAIGHQPTFLVVRVLDGGTIELAGGQRIRYIGVDSPQMRNTLGQPDAGAWEAREANRRLVANRRVRLEADQLDADADGVWQRYVYADDLLVNAELLRQGAVLYLSRYPNTRRAAALLAAEQEARRHKRGLWKQET